MNRKRQKARARIAAGAASSLMHLAMFSALLLPLAATALSKRPPPDQQAVVVTLVRLSGGSSPNDAQAALEQLREQLARDTPPLADDQAQTSSQSASRLLDAFQPSQSSTPDKPPGRAGLSGSSSNANLDPYARAAVSMRSTDSQGDLAIWRQVAPCWRPVPNAAKVTLSVVLDDKGRLVGDAVAPHDIFSGIPRSGELTEARRALAACAPYSVPPGGARIYRLEFSGPGQVRNVRQPHSVVVRQDDHRRNRWAARRSVDGD